MAEPRRRSYDLEELWKMAQVKSRVELADWFGVSVVSISNWLRREGMTCVDGRSRPRETPGSKRPPRNLLLHHRRNGRSYQWIADHYGVSKTRARQWILGNDLNKH